MERYQRQIRLGQIGAEGQARLRGARVLLLGCGALGTVVGEQLARAGVGELVIADRDIVEWSNLQRQALFGESDVGRAKVEAAARRLAEINSEVRVDPRAIDVAADNIAGLADGACLIVDGTDNVETRYLINDLAVKHRIDWVYGACVGWEGRVMAFRTRDGGPCLRCVYPNPPAGVETCDIAGVLGPAAGVVASMESVAAIKLLTGNAAGIADELVAMDFWRNRIHSTKVERDPDCPCCGGGVFPFLEAASPAVPIALCGREAVQVRPAGRRVDLAAMAERWAGLGPVERTRFFVRCNVGDGLDLTLFEDGRLIVKGTTDAGRARGAYARYVG